MILPMNQLTALIAHAPKGWRTLESAACNPPASKNAASAERTLMRNLRVLKMVPRACWLKQRLLLRLGRFLWDLQSPVQAPS